MNENAKVLTWQRVTDIFSGADKRQAAAADRELNQFQEKRKQEAGFLQFFRDQKLTSGWVETGRELSPQERFMVPEESQMLQSAERAADYLSKTDGISQTASRIVKGDTTIKFTDEAKEFSETYLAKVAEFQPQLDAMSQQTLAEARSYAGVLKTAKWLLHESRKHKGLTRVAGIAAVGLLLVGGCFMVWRATGGPQWNPGGPEGPVPVDPENNDSQHPTDQPANTPAPTLTPTSTLASTHISVPPLGGISGCTPVSGIESLMPRNLANTLIAIDWRDAFNSLANFDANHNGAVNLAQPDELSPAEKTMACWGAQMAKAAEGGIIRDGHITIFDKMVELLGFETKATSLKSFDTVWIDWRDHPRLALEIQTHKEVAVVTTGSNLSETLVRLSEQLASAGRNIVGPNGQVLSADQIFNGITKFMSVPALEGKWSPGVNPLSVDEIKQMCLTYRPFGSASDRLAQPESSERAQWDNGILLGKEVRGLDGLRLSNQGVMGVVTRLVPEGELKQVLSVLETNRHQATWAEVANGSGGKLFAVTMIFDLSERMHKPLTGTEADQEKGSGGQLIPCGVKAEVVPPSKTPTATGTLHSTPTKGVTQTPPREGTPGTQATPDRTPATQITTTGTTPPETTRVTPAPTITSQPPIPISTPGGHINPPTAVATPANTPAPVETPRVVPTAFPQPVATRTPSAP